MTMAEMDVDQIRVLLAPLWAKNRSHILDRLIYVRSALSGEEPMSQAVRADLHALVGTLGTYGFPYGSDLAAAILAATTIGGIQRHPEFLSELDDLIDTLSRT